MFVLMIVLFVIGYLCIALEHPLKINKSATALLLGAVLWVCAVIGGEDILFNPEAFTNYLMTHSQSSFIDWLVHSQLLYALGEVSQIIFFLLGAMTIVEIVDTQGGFKIITDRIRTTNEVKLLWVISILSFFMSAVLDNLTSSIVMCALLRKLIDDKHERWFFASMVIISANSGGAWSPIGDVTTIMLWIAGKVTAANIIISTFLASLMSIIVPLVVLSFMMRGGHVARPQMLEKDLHQIPDSEPWQQRLFLILGVSALLFVPVFKTVTHLPPYLGMLGGLGVLWITSEIVHRKKTEEEKRPFDILTIFKKIDIASVMFFLGILIAVNALQTMGHLQLLAGKLDTIPLEEASKYYVINVVIGILSSIVDNVPMVAGALGMYDFPTDHYFWEFLAYCAGTGGSILIIGSAAGVAVMGMEKIDFIWYLKKMSWIALLGYIAGALTFVGEQVIRERLGAHTEEATTFQFNEEGIKTHLLDNTFVVDLPTDKAETMTIDFVEYKSNKTDSLYYGVIIDAKTMDADNNVFLNKTKSSALSRSNCQVMMSDSTASANIADYSIQITKTGLTYIESRAGLVELKKAN